MGSGSIRIRFLVSVLSFVMATGAYAESGPEYIVKLKSGLRSMNRVPMFQSTENLDISELHDDGDLMKVEVKNDLEGLEEIAALQGRWDVEYVVPNATLYAFENVTNDPQASKQWSIDAVKLAGAWAQTKGSREVVVAVIDTGVDTNHEDLKANIWTNEKEIAGNGKDDDENGFIDDIHGWDFNSNDNDPNDETSFMQPGHGTHCAGAVGAVGDNKKGIVGANHAVTIMPLRFLSATGGGDLFASVKAIDYAVANGAHVISASWGATISRAGAKPILEAIERARDAGVVFVVAAANDGKSNDKIEVYPANAGFDNVINVAASNKKHGKPKWSNFGRRTVDIAAPGEDIFSTLPKNKYGNLSGTSMATPLVAGIVGLIKSREEAKDLTPLQIRSILQSTGIVSTVKSKSDRVIDAAAAIDAVIEKKLTVVPAAATIEIDGTLQFAAVGGAGDYEFSVSDAEVASLDESGLLTGLKEGQIEVLVKDSADAEAQSLAIYVVAKAGSGGGDEGGGQPPEVGDCPLGNPFLCMISCLFMPEAPWCKGDGDGGGGDDDKKNPFPFPVPGM